MHWGLLNLNNNIADFFLSRSNHFGHGRLEAFGFLQVLTPPVGTDQARIDDAVDQGIEYRRHGKLTVLFGQILLGGHQIGVTDFRAVELGDDGIVGVSQSKPAKREGAQKG